MVKNIDLILKKLKTSSFRNRFHLKKNDLAYINQKGLEVIKTHAFDFINKRLSDSVIPNDGKQTPFKGHPVFIAQHATATCCRSCLFKWHHIPKNTKLSNQQIEYIVDVIMTWMKNELENTI